MNCLHQQMMAKLLKFSLFSGLGLSNVAWCDRYLQICPLETCHCPDEIFVEYFFQRQQKYHWYLLWGQGPC